MTELSESVAATEKTETAKLPRAMSPSELT